MIVELAGVRVAFFIDPPPTESQILSLLDHVSNIDSVESSGATGYFVVIYLKDCDDFKPERIEQAIREIREVLAEPLAYYGPANPDYIIRIM